MLACSETHMWTPVTPYILSCKTPTVFCHWIVTFTTFHILLYLNIYWVVGWSWFCNSVFVSCDKYTIWRCLQWCVTGDWVGSGPAARGGGGTQHSATGSGPSSYLGDSSCKLILFCYIWFFKTRHRGVQFVDLIL